jgi:hypothetical protein
MSRIPSGDTVVVRPANNVYTALTGAAALVTAIGLILVLMRAKDLLGGFPTLM